MLSVVEAVDEQAPAASVADAEAATPAPAAPAGERGVTLNQVVGLLLAIVGLRVGLDSLHDNSFFTHLATGHLIFERGGIPRTDPYSFTAHGQAWTVQSWGASVVYAAVDSVAGGLGLRLLIATCTTALAVLVWKLTSAAGGLVGRLAIAVPVIAVGATMWVERPLIFSLLLLAAVLFAIEDRLDPRWLLPVMAIWVNVHGSFPIGLAAIGAFGVGRLLDRERPRVELRAMGWALAGTLIGGVANPLGPRLLVFPFQLLSRRQAFSQIVEWQAPTWQDWGQRFFALQLVLALVLLALRCRRWRLIVPVVAFAAISLQSSRNIAQASLVFIPAMAVAARGLGAIDGDRPMAVLRPVRLALGALAALVLAVGITSPNYDLQDYPVEAAGWMRAHDLLDRSDRVVSRDFVGNWMEAAYGPDRVQVYMDDRVDMYPIEHIADYTTLIDPKGDYAAVLARARATAVLWDTDSGLGDWLEDPQNGWKIVHRDPNDLWIVAVPAS